MWKTTSCERALNEEDKKFLENMNGTRKGEVSSLDRVAVAKNKEKSKKFCSEKRKSQ